MVITWKLLFSVLWISLIDSIDNVKIELSALYSGRDWSYYVPDDTTYQDYLSDLNNYVTRYVAPIVGHTFIERFYFTIGRL